MSDTVDEVPLCDPDEVFALPVFPQENPSFPTAGDYQELDEIAELARETLRFLRCPLKRFGVGWLRGRQLGLARQRPIMAPGVSRLEVMFGQAKPKGFEYDLSFSKKVFHSPGVDRDVRVQTVIHEACHIVDFVRNERNFDPSGYSGAGTGHGPDWQALMVECGVPPDATYSGESVWLPHVECPKCGRRAPISVRSMNAVRRRGGWFVCRGCGTKMTQANVVQPEGSPQRRGVPEREPEPDEPEPVPRRRREPRQVPPVAPSPPPRPAPPPWRVPPGAPMPGVAEAARPPYRGMVVPPSAPRPWVPPVWGDPEPTNTPLPPYRGILTGPHRK